MRRPFLEFEDLLDEFNRLGTDGLVSFASIRQVIGEFGFYAIGSVLSFGDLKKDSNPSHCAIAL